MSDNQAQSSTGAPILLRPTCIAKTKSGKPCNARALPDGPYCWAHEPSLAAKRKDARSRGGHARHRRKIGKQDVHTFDEMRPPTQIRSVDDVMTLLEKAVHDLFSMENSISRSRAVVAVALAALKALEVGEHEQRIAELEARIGKE